MRRILIGSLFAGAALAAVTAASGAAALTAAAPAQPMQSLPICISGDIGGLDLNQLCKEVAPG